jgi:hypothetical protein
MRPEQRKDRRRATRSDAERRLPTPICYQQRYPEMRATDPLPCARTDPWPDHTTPQANAQRPAVPTDTSGSGSPLCQEGGCSRLGSVRRSSPLSSRERLTAAAVRRGIEGAGNSRKNGLGDVGSWLAGPGSDFSEVPAPGCEPAALELAAVPMCPPGPAAFARVSRTIWWQAMSESRRFRQRVASLGVLPAATLRS